MGSQAIVIANNNIILPVTYIYTYTGADQTVTVPAGYNTFTGQWWGAGGAVKGQGGLSPSYYNGSAGGGGYTEATFSKGSTSLVSNGITSIIVKVGQGGISLTNASNVAPATYGGGGAGPGNGGNWGSASGGGRSAVVIGSTEIITAGGGGAAGTYYNLNTQYGGSGGAGGGLVGGNAYNNSAEGGSGGNTTTSTGGAGGTSTYGNGSPGTQFTGGSGGSYANGGGGGYYGGGGGSAGDGSKNGGGGGGSSYVLPSGTSGITVTNSIITQAVTIVFNSQNVATGAPANNAGLPTTYKNTIGGGGLASNNTTSTNQSGQNGIVLITFSRV